MLLSSEQCCGVGGSGGGEPRAAACVEEDERRRRVFAPDLVPFPREPEPSKAGEGQLALDRGVLGGLAAFWFCVREGKGEKRG